MTLSGCFRLRVDLRGPLTVGESWWLGVQPVEHCVLCLRLVGLVGVQCSHLIHSVTWTHHYVLGKLRVIGPAT